MQKRLDETELLAGSINIKINPIKSFSMHLSGVTPVGTRDTTFHIQNQQIRSLRDGKIDRFLGMPVGFQITIGVKEVAKLMETADKILKSNVAPWQKLDALKSIYFPLLYFQMRTAHLQKGDWTKLDEYIRASIKRILNVPQEASNDYVYGPAKQGCAGIPQTASEYDHQLIDNAFRLLTSKNSGTKELAYEDLQTTVQKRINRPSN
jgi:hypothetical protein